jgi:hypothetical protein
MYRQERDDRLYVERLFVIREEHHGRGHIHVAENNSRAAVAAMREFETRMLFIAEEHSTQQAALQARLEDSSHIARLRRQLRDGLERLEEERAAVVALQREVAVADDERKSAVDEEREAWASDKALLLQRIDALEATITKLRVSGAAPELSPLPKAVVQPAHAPVHHGYADLRSRSAESARSGFDRMLAPTVYGDASAQPSEGLGAARGGGPRSDTTSQSRADERVRQEHQSSRSQRSSSVASAEVPHSAPRANTKSHNTLTTEHPETRTELEQRGERSEQQTMSAASLRPAHTAMERTRLLLARASSALNSSHPSH